MNLSICYGRDSKQPSEREISWKVLCCRRTWKSQLQKQFMHRFPIPIVLSEQNRLVLSKDIVRNGSHQALRCFSQQNFMVTDFEQRLDFNPQEPEKFTTKRWLKKGAIPSLDCVVSVPQVQAISARARKQVNIIMHKLVVCGILKLLHIYP